MKLYLVTWISQSGETLSRTVAAYSKNDAKRRVFATAPLTSMTAVEVKP